ncbi:hypothetical protein BK133_23500 [Paenibacillus sp. FSL H8-0548]|uniref:hypothetical protein n=1 Tax=Paenibacillus sp. FSL H8-0548 TaxID=1920422 RepID=UPI00096E326C|nr:hypothetical protein [Paenibacillus sp. FSL H8-0548]OMF23858.1 hypothetical protein BK133_23500 [Paenibacillus sp. FSL H8-0548]
MLAHYQICQSGTDFAEYTLFFIKHRADFKRQFSLSDTLLHILQASADDKIMLIKSPQNETIGWVHFKYLASSYESDPQGEIAFVDSVIIDNAYRSSRLFIEGFRHLISHIAEENKQVKQFEFHCLASQPYLNRLYSKFATLKAQRECDDELENIYLADFLQLQLYLNTTKSYN